MHLKPLKIALIILIWMPLTGSGRGAAGFNWLAPLMAVEKSARLGSARINGHNTPMVMLPQSGDVEESLERFLAVFRGRMTFSLDRSGPVPVLMGIDMKSTQCPGCKPMHAAVVEERFREGMVVTFIPTGMPGSGGRDLMMIATGAAGIMSAGQRAYEGMLPHAQMSRAAVETQATFLFDHRSLHQTVVQVASGCVQFRNDLRTTILNQGFTPVNVVVASDGRVGNDAGSATGEWLFAKGDSLVAVSANFNGNINNNTCRMAIYEHTNTR